jgi:16S rRNA (guanine1207-N2)-methyltransferase
VTRRPTPQLKSRPAPPPDPAASEPEYYRWSNSDVAVPGGLHVTVANRAALGSVSAELRLAETATRLIGTPPDRILHYGCGRGLLGLLLSRQNPNLELTLADDNWVAAEAARRTVQQASIAARVQCSDLPPLASCDLAVLTLSRGRHRAMEILSSVARSSPAILIVVAANDDGARGLIRVATEMFGQPVEQEGMRHSRAGRFQLTTGRRQSAAGNLDSPTQFEVTLDQISLRVATRPGIFADGRVDPGTMSLLRTLEIGENARCLDLGSGSGIIGAFMATRASRGSAILIDASSLATKCSQTTLDLNHITNAEVRLGDIYEPVAEMRFDVIACNPPFHRGAKTEYEIANEMIRSARSLASPSARFYLVANRFLGYETAIRRYWPSFSTVYEAAGYKVFRAIAD